MQEHFEFLDKNANPIPGLTFSQSLSWGGTPYHDSIRGFVILMGLAGLFLDDKGIGKQERDIILHSIGSIREEFSGASATREEIVQEARKHLGRFTTTCIHGLFQALPEITDLKEELRQELNDDQYFDIVGEPKHQKVPSP